MMERLTWRQSTVETTAIVAVVLVCLAFLASFIFGLRDVRAPDVQGAAPSAVLAGPDSSAGRVEVLNASGRGGMARHVTSRLRGDGFDVVFFGNAPASAGDSSVVLDRSGRDDVARDVARALDIGAVRTQLDSTLYLDATVIVGVDWSPMTEVAPAERTGWRRALDWVGLGR